MSLGLMPNTGFIVSATHANTESLALLKESYVTPLVVIIRGKDRRHARSGLNYIALQHPHCCPV